MKRIPVAKPDLSELEERYVLEAVRSSWISSSGPFVDRFEQGFARICGARAAVSVSNGTVALHLALLALEVGPGDEVIIPSLTYVATANAVSYVGAVPIFVEIDADTWCIDPSLIEAVISPRTKGIIAVHLYGHPADMDAINEVASRHGLWVIEDAAEAHFARYKGRPVGGLATMATFSFYGNKVVSSGEGGAITVNDAELEHRLRMLRSQGMDPDTRYHFPIIGYNYRLTNVACALLCAQLERRVQILEKRRRVFDSYTAGLSDVAGIGLQPIAGWAEPTRWLYCITVDETALGVCRDELMSVMEAFGIETRPFFRPVHRLPPYEEASFRNGHCLPVTDHLASTGLNLPTFSGLTEDDLQRVIGVIRCVARGDKADPLSSKSLEPTRDELSIPDDSSIGQAVTVTEPF